VRTVLVALATLFAACSLPASAQLAHSQPEWYLPTGDGCDLFVQEFGQGPETIVILHGGWGAEHSYLFNAFKGFDERYHVVFYDQRGSLLSPCPVDKISVQKHVDDLELLRKTLGLERMNLVAHSMGTFLAMTYQQQHSEHVKGLVLMGSLPARTPKTDTEKQWHQEQESGIQKIANDIPAIEPELHKLGLDIKDAKTWTPQQHSLAWHISFANANIYHLDRWKQVRGGAAFYNGEAGQAAAKTMPTEWDFTPALAVRACSTWVIDGDHDYVTDPAGKMFHAATADIPGVHVVVLKDAAHLSWIDAPNDFHNELQTALQSATQCVDRQKKLQH
jgi:proline iminopeptidase